MATASVTAAAPLPRPLPRPPFSTRRRGPPLPRPCLKLAARPSRGGGSVEAASGLPPWEACSFSLATRAAATSSTKQRSPSPREGLICGGKRVGAPHHSSRCLCLKTFPTAYSVSASFRSCFQYWKWTPSPLGHGVPLAALQRRACVCPACGGHAPRPRSVRDAMRAAAASHEAAGAVRQAAVVTSEELAQQQGALLWNAAAIRRILGEISAIKSAKLPAVPAFERPAFLLLLLQLLLLLLCQPQHSACGTAAGSYDTLF